MESCKFLVLALCCSFLVSTTFAVVVCPSGYTAYETDVSCYKYVDTDANFADAEAACVADGGNLASVTSQAEHDFLISDIWPSVTGTYVYIGGSDAAVEGTWLWTDASGFTFDSWGIWNRQQLPVYGTVANCLTMTKVTDETGDWYDFQCADTAHYICEKPGTVSALQCDKSDGRNWQLVNEKCYFLVRGMKTWPRAESNCVKMSGQLASVHESSLTNYFVNTWVDRYGRGMWIGLNDRTTEGTFVWTDSTSSSYSNWAVLNSVQQPENDEAKNCVGIESPARGLAGQWNDYRCQMKAWSICQKEAI